MYKAVIYQTIGTLLAGCIAGLLFSFNGMISALLAGFSYVIPSLFFVVCLSRRKEASLGVFVFGDLIKVFFTIVILLIMAVCYSKIHWGSVILGLIFTLLSNLWIFRAKT